MSPKKQLYKQEYATELLNIAAGDLASAEALAAAGRGRRENICFLAHQAVEKSLKAVICFRKKPVILTHDMDALMATMDQQDTPPHAEVLQSLTLYSSVRRYEEGYEILDGNDIKNILSIAQDVVAWAKKTIALK